MIYYIPLNIPPSTTPTTTIPEVDPEFSEDLLLQVHYLLQQVVALLPTLTGGQTKQLHFAELVHTIEAPHCMTIPS